MAEVVGVFWTQTEVDYLEIDLERDTERGIFLTMGLAQRHPSPYVKAMYASSASFWQLHHGLQSQGAGGDRSAEARAHRMLTFPEPRETRLGYTTFGSAGSGVGAGQLRDLLFATLRASREARVGLITAPDTLGLLPEIGLDRASDIVTTIVKRDIIDYTIDRAAFYGFDPHCMQVHRIPNCWTPASERLETVVARVPTDDLGRPFLLVPKGICRSGPPMTPAQYFRDVGPSSSGASAGGADSAKLRLLADAAANPQRLSKFAEDRMRDERRFRPRRELRDR